MTSPDRLRLPDWPAGVARVREARAGIFPLYSHPAWLEGFPWLVQGTTGRGDDELDLGLFGHVPTGIAQARWRRLREVTGMPAAIHARQVHGARLLWHSHSHAGLLLMDDADAHATRETGLLLTVSVADCVPIFLVATEPRAVALLHGGWRGVAAGILEQGIAALVSRAGARPEDLHLHCGPAICANCYEVGPEVPAALDIASPVGAKVSLDLRAVVVARALAAGLPPSHVSVSNHCTRCDSGLFWSHRGGCRGRQMGILGLH